MTTSNTKGAITAATAAQAAAPARKTPAQLMNAILTSEATQNMLQRMCKENAGAITASILDLYNTDTYLQQCDPKQVFGECLKAVSLNLPINKQLGFAWIIPYKGVPQFQIGYKGLIQLAMRTGAYRYINAGPVYEGELQKTDKLTGAIDLNGPKISDKVIGYFAYIETLNGFSKTLYWTDEYARNHAARYSKSYKTGSAIWKDNYEEMQVKSVLRNLLNHWGVMSVDMQTAIAQDIAGDTADFEGTATEVPHTDAHAYAYTDTDTATAQLPPPNIDPETGEVIE